jgi:hypothetical protein
MAVQLCADILDAVKSADSTAAGLICGLLPTFDFKDPLPERTVPVFML